MIQALTHQGFKICLIPFFLLAIWLSINLANQFKLINKHINTIQKSNLT